MQKKNKITKLLESKCSQCGSCCCDPLIELTHFDIRRLVDHTGISADRLVKLYSSSDMDGEEEQEWIRLSYGKRMIGLSKKRNGSCMFLSREKSCTAYEARPMSCRLFPINVEFEEDEKTCNMELSDIIKDKFINCKRSSGKARPYKEFFAVATNAMKEYEEYSSRIEKWNSSSERGGKQELLEYLVSSKRE